MVFVMRLAAHLGKTLAELARDMTLTEFRLWREFYEREPWGMADAALRALGKSPELKTKTPEEIERKLRAAVSERLVTHGG